jgi:D-inositol-3-phosphate glycosyltransferase
MVRFVGAVDLERLPDYYAAADVCVVPSRYESFGLAAIEAMACGTPVVASRVGGLQVTVEDGATGFLVPWRSPELFAEKLHLLLSDAPLRQRLGARAAESARQYAWPRVATAILDLYQEVLAAKAVVSG